LINERTFNKCLNKRLNSWFEQTFKQLFFQFKHAFKQTFKRLNALVDLYSQLIAFCFEDSVRLFRFMFSNLIIVLILNARLGEPSWHGERKWKVERLK